MTIKPRPSAERLPLTHRADFLFAPEEQRVDPRDRAPQFLRDLRAVQAKHLVRAQEPLLWRELRQDLLRQDRAFDLFSSAHVRRHHR